MAAALWRFMISEGDLWSPVMDHGQLLIGAVGVSGSSVARLVRRSISNPAIVVIVASFFQATLGSLLFATLVALPGQAQPDRVVGLSLIFWLLAVLLGALSVELGRE